MNPRLINSSANSFATESGIAANGGASTTKQRVFGWTHAMALAGCIAFGLSGCGQGKAASAAPPPPQVHVATASTGEVVDWDTFTGRFEAPETVKLRPRVSGYIDQVRFAEGRDVKKGDVLFVIDQRPYQVQFERTQADYVRMQARSQLAASELARSQKLLAAHAVSQEEYDQRASERAQARADELAAHAAMNAAKLNLEYTQVTSPIDGRISRAEVTTGNYVSAGETILTSLVSLDPIYVYFEGDEQTYLKYMNLAKLGERPSSRENANPVFIGLANEDDFPHAGKMNFVDNALSPETGTIRARAQIDNPEHLFTPGMLARVKLQGSGKYQATLIDDEAVVTDQDRKYVMVVNAQNVIEYRAVELKGIFNNQRIVSGGLQPGERIVVSGLQRVRPGMTVAPQETSATANDNTQPRPNVRKVAATNIETTTAQTVNY